MLINNAPIYTSFASSIKESSKSFTLRSTFDETSQGSWYVFLENSINFKDVKITAPLPTTKISQENKETMRNWACVNMIAVRKRTVRQEKMIHFICQQK